MSLNHKLFFFAFLFSPPLLISRLISSRQLLQAGAEKRKFVGFRHISQICVTLLVWKKFRCEKGAEHTNTDQYLLMNAIVSWAYHRAPKQINAPRMKVFLVGQLTYSTLMWFCPRRFISTQTTADWEGKKSWAPPPVMLAWDQLCQCPWLCSRRGELSSLQVPQVLQQGQQPLPL